MELRAEAPFRVRAGRSRPRGIVLVLVSGIVTLLAVLALSMGSIVRIAAARGERDRALSASRLAAGSGLEYAASRLAVALLPRRIADPAARGDDWTFRDPPLAALDRSRNPSYSHGEPWREQGGKPGAFDAGSDAPGADADGSGGFSAWTGRLRGARARFALKIGSLDGRIPLNAGRLSGYEIDPDSGALLPTWQLHMLYPHDAIWIALDELDDTAGQGVPGLLPGYDLIVHRPEGGYRSWDQVERTLSALSYPQATIDAIRPFLDLKPLETEYERISLSLHGMPREVLEAVWRGAFRAADRVRIPYDPFPFLPGGIPPDSFPYLDRVGSYFERNLADAAIRLREEGDVAWGAFRARLLSEAETIFPIGAAGWDALKDPDGDPSNGLELAAEFDTPDKRRRFQLQLAAWAYHLVSSDAFPPDGTPPGFSCLRTWATGGIEGDGTPAGRAAPLARSLPDLLRLTLAPPTRFAVASRGASAGGEAEVAGDLQAAERLEWTTQEDFEGWAEAKRVQEGMPTRLSRRGISLVQDPAPAVRHDWDGSASVRAPRVVSLPAWNAWGVMPPLTGSPAPFHTRDGALTLGSVRQGRGSSQLYWGFPDDFDGTVNGEGESEQDVSPDPMAPLPWPAPPPPYAIYFSLTNLSNHHEVNGGQSVQCPACDAPYDLQDGYADLEAPPPPRQDSKRTALRELGFEGWFGPGSSVKVVVGNDQGWLQLFSHRSTDSAGAPGVRFVLRVKWPRGCWYFRAPTGLGGTWSHFIGDPLDKEHTGWFVPDPPSGASGSHHVYLTMRREGKGWINESTLTQAGIPPGGGEPYKTRFTLHVNGQPQGDWLLLDQAAPTLKEQSGGLNILAVSGEQIHVERVDEIRFYARPPIAPPPTRDRFLDYGTFTSPLYRLDAPAKLLQSQWWGWVPADRGEPVSAELVPCDALGNALGAPAPLGGRGEIRDLTGAAGSPVRAFRYRVRFDCTSAPEPFLEPPVFESLWVAFRRGPPRWSGVSFR